MAKLAPQLLPPLGGSVESAAEDDGDASLPPRPGSPSGKALLKMTDEQAVRLPTCHAIMLYKQQSYSDRGATQASLDSTSTAGSTATAARIVPQY